jgi:alanine racemase
MHRLGVPPAAVAELHARLLRCQAVKAPVRVMTHLADADDPHKDVTSKQVDVMHSCTSQLDVELSIGNSAGIMAWPGARSDWVRPGIMLYGVSPFANDCGTDHGLRPAMTLASQVMAINDVVKGARVGYGGAYSAPEAMRVGAIAAGYADGYPRHVPNGASVLVDGVSVQVAGRISMDTVTVDLRAHGNAKVGSQVVLWGEALPVEYVARAAGTIGYELLTRVGSRVPRVMQRHDRFKG